MTCLVYSYFNLSKLCCHSIGNFVIYQKSTSNNIKLIYFVSITHEGTSIDYEIRLYLFHRLVKGKTGDTGLGLAISRAIIEQTGGYITVHNREDAGAEFTLVFNKINE